MRCAVLPPVPVPYREPLFGRLGERDRIGLRVIYQSSAQPGWDQAADWFPDEHPYPSEALAARQRRRAGRTPVLLPRGLGTALDRCDPDCIVSWEYGAATLRSLAWARRRGRPVVVFSELTPWTEPALSPGRRRLQRRLLPRFAGFIAASTAARRRLLDLGVAADRIEVSLQSADVDAFRAAPRDAEGATVRLLSVGRLVPDKNLELLLEAFAEAEIAAEAELELCGAGPLEAELRALAEQLRIPVRFAGYSPPAELPSLYGTADAFVLASTFEPFGASVREAAAAGLPIVCTRVAGAAGDFAVEGENALLVDPSDRSSVATALRRVVREPDLRARLAQGSDEVTERHPLEADVEAFERAVLRVSPAAPAPRVP